MLAATVPSVGLDALVTPPRQWFAATATHSHPSLALSEDHVKGWSAEGEVVFDPMRGSGQVCLAAKRLGRQWLGFDVSAEYVELATKRLTAI